MNVTSVSPISVSQNTAQNARAQANLQLQVEKAKNRQDDFFSARLNISRLSVSAQTMSRVSRKKEPVGAREAERFTFVDKSRPNDYAVLSKERSYLSYALGMRPAQDQLLFADEGESDVFILYRAESEQHARSIFEASGALSRHASPTVGYVKSRDGAHFVVCEVEGRAAIPQLKHRRLVISSLSLAERELLASRTMVRVKEMHDDSLTVEGISPSDIQFAGGEVKALNPTRIRHVEPDDHKSVFFGTVATIRALAGGSVISKYSEVQKLADELIASSLMDRAAVLYLFKTSEAGEKRASLSTHIARKAWDWVPHFRKN